MDTLSKDHARECGSKIWHSCSVLMLYLKWAEFSFFAVPWDNNYRQDFRLPGAQQHHAMVAIVNLSWDITYRVGVSDLAVAIPSTVR